MKVTLYVNEYIPVQVVSKYMTCSGIALKEYLRFHPESLIGITDDDKMLLYSLLDSAEHSFSVCIDGETHYEGVKEFITRIAYLGEITYEF